jgi:hypothetical protein
VGDAGNNPAPENLVPMKAMEDVIAMSWTVYDGANWKNIWIEGDLIILHTGSAGKL